MADADVTISPIATEVQGSLRVTLPAGWTYKESLTLRTPGGEANVIVSSEPVPADMTPSDYAEMQGELLKEEFDEFAVVGRPEHAGPFGMEPTVLAGVGEAWLREFTWRPPESETVRQVQVYAVGRGRGFTATATTLEAGYEQCRVALMDVLFSIVVDLGVIQAAPSAAEP